MPAYIIAEHDVSDAETYARARPGAAAAIAKYRGRYLVNGLGKAELVEGECEPKRFVVLEFPDMNAARAFYQSDDYREARLLRQLASRSRIVLVEGSSSAGLP